MKHTNPCGVASCDDILEVYRLAIKAYPVKVFGGIMAFNVEVDDVKAKVQVQQHFFSKYMWLKKFILINNLILGSFIE